MAKGPQKWKTIRKFPKMAKGPQEVTWNLPMERHGTLPNMLMLSSLFSVVPCEVDVGCIDGYYYNYSRPQLMFWVDATFGAYIQRKKHMYT
jgi:hypothetical protein